MSLDVSTSGTESSAVQTVELSVVVPAYREGRRIHANLTRLLDELEKLGVTYEVVVVSDGNTDATVREALRVESSKVKVFHYPMNIGKGFALSCGVDQSVDTLFDTLFDTLSLRRKPVTRGSEPI